jgi:ribosomal protein S18 acetylase RimI-like enzyme
MAFEKRPYHPDQINSISTFVSSATDGLMSAQRAAYVLEKIISDPDAVCDIHLMGKRVGVGIVIDHCVAEGNAAELSIYVHPFHPGISDIIVEWALKRCRESGSSNLDLPEWHGLDFPRDWLMEKQFYLGYQIFDMKADTKKIKLSEKELTLENCRWEVFDIAYLEKLHEAVRLAFADVPGAYLEGLDAFARICSERHDPYHLLLNDKDQIVGFVRVEMLSAKKGEINFLGRHPRVRGSGIGNILLEKSIRLLIERGAKEIQLDVAARNRKAIKLYEEYSFYIVHVMNVFRKRL